MDSDKNITEILVGIDKRLKETVEENPQVPYQFGSFQGVNYVWGSAESNEYKTGEAIRLEMTIVLFNELLEIVRN